MCLMAFLFLAVLFLQNQNKLGRWKNWALSIDFWLYIYVLYTALWSHSHRNLSEKLTSSWTCEILSFIVRQCLWYTILNEDAQQTSWLLKIITTTIKHHGKWSNVLHFHCILLLLYTTEHMLELIRLVTARVCYLLSGSWMSPLEMELPLTTWWPSMVSKPCGGLNIKQRQNLHLQLLILKTLSVRPAGLRTHALPFCSLTP